jgi:hypothetical protein
VNSGSVAAFFLRVPVSSMPASRQYGLLEQLSLVVVLRASEPMPVFNGPDDHMPADIDPDRSSRRDVNAWGIVITVDLPPQFSIRVFSNILSRHA